jgi:hypothetical protein
MSTQFSKEPNSMAQPSNGNWVFEQLDQDAGYTREVLRRRTPTDPASEPAA